jgi:asparagine synthase (glutamine-hydrolysing)
MCGIAGFVGQPPHETQDILERMSRSLAHRGPDDSSRALWPTTSDPETATAFVHSRLAIIDLSPNGRQPMTSVSGRFTTIFNGEIYNYRGLKAELIRAGCRFRTATDTEVLMAVIEREGHAGLRRLRGMFTFVLFDHETGECLVARDRLGIKPFYYYTTPGRLLFASELRTLLDSSLVPRRLDPISVASYLSFGAVQEPRTIVDGVRTLPPGNSMRISARGAILDVKPYFRFPEAAGICDRAEARVRLRAGLEEAIRLHLIADVPVGAFLSGGIDSGSLVALMARVASGPVKTFTVCFEEQDYNEREPARLVANRWGTTHTEMTLGESELLRSLPAAMAAIDQPTIDGINTWYVSRAARQAGLTVAISGLGGDELFGGYPSFRRVPRTLRLGLPAAMLGHSTRRRLAGAATAVMGNSLMAQKVASAIEGGADLLSAYLSVRGLISAAPRQRLLATATPPTGRAYALPAESMGLLQLPPGGDVFNGVTTCELQLYTANMLLRDTDAMSMAHALEVRVPLLDHEIVEFALRLPGQVKSGTRPKSLLIEAMGNDLPDQIVSRRKMGFTLPFDRWLRGPLQNLVNDTLGDKRSVRYAGLDPPGVASVVSRFQAHATSAHWSTLWALVVLVNWSARHKVEHSD